MGLLRSEPMSQGVLLLPRQDAKKYIDLIGRKLNMQFEDMNTDHMRRPYRKYVQRIEEMERILRFITAELAKSDVGEVTRNKIPEFLENVDNYDLSEVEADLQTLYKDLVKATDNNGRLFEEKNQTIEEIQVVARALVLLQGSRRVAASSDLTAPLVGADSLDRRICNVAGVVTQADETRLRLAMFRASRGNAYADFYPIEQAILDPKTGNPVKKSVFVVYFQGSAGASSPMHQKVIKVCQAMGVNLYNWPADESAASRRSIELQAILREKEAALTGYNKFVASEMKRMLEPPAAGLNSRIEEYRLFCVKEKSQYNIMNMFNEHDVILRTSVWYPTAEQGKIESELAAGAAMWNVERAMLMAKKGGASMTPPTYIRTNEYTEGWQEVINTYGLPRYQEANPALFACVTFPFIFGMMYGDIGHGTLLLLAGIFLCMNSESMRYSSPELFKGRYMVLSMGIFATFAGFMYNDFFSLGVQLFESRFECPEEPDGSACTPKASFSTTNEVGGGGPYPFGLDWAWAGASNELLYVNSLKMKLSVLFGVAQMILGVFLRWSNAFYEKNMVDFAFECVPMMIFMICFFGWMDWMILYKWTHPIDSAPSIINSLICMAMDQEDKFPIYEGSVETSKFLYKLTLLSVPFMLFPKPFILKHQHEAKAKEGGHFIAIDEEHGASAGGHGHGGHGEEFEFGEVFIHQIIETIEYVLGTVSHTASYLRIWALSLAHQQLSLVFFQKTLSMGLVMTGPMNGVMLYIMFAAWFGVTLAVLLGMDVLECFLHTLRLHWVEFQSKFYKADGYKFEPYNLPVLVSTSADA
eukprot:TRINITY_DN5724_c0_g1_i5.p1 TRINITY_DN5724_c0_g1~~TRINITY_DN5724_c0_g1_i5.p1  ORF type:complete len:812 (-),score=250.07 TRINITY_DN5724_c0_g1_i5:234-2669(-)